MKKYYPRKHTLQILSVVFIAALLLTACEKKESHAEENNAQESAEKKNAHDEPSEQAQQAAKAEEAKEEGGAQQASTTTGNPKLKVGDQAPAWSLESDNDGLVDSASLKGQKYILYFYPKDHTQGCTMEAIDFQKNEKAFADKGYKLFGVSSDSVESHKGFRDEYDLKFTLLSDPDYKIADEYGVYREREIDGQKVKGTIRSTFVVDANGVLTQVLDKVDPRVHVEELLSSL